MRVKRVQLIKKCCFAADGLGKKRCKKNSTQASWQLGVLGVATQRSRGCGGVAYNVFMVLNEGVGMRFGMGCEV